MADASNSQPPISQESASQSTPEGSNNPSPHGPTPSESVQTPYGETSDNMDICIQRKIRMKGKKGQTFLMAKVMQGKQELGTRTYDAENAREELANAIIMHEYPLSIVDHLGFKRYSAALQPLFQVPSRNTIKKEIFKVYDFERLTALKLLKF